MSRRSWWFITLLCSALGLTMGAAHALELPQKLGYHPELYAAINTTLYRYFALVGGVLMIGSLLSASVLTYLVRRRPVFRSTLAATGCLALSLALWFALVSPVNAEVAQALHSAPESVPALWKALRDRWEYGHVASFAAWLLGFVLLTYSAVLEMPGEGEAALTPEAVRDPRETKSRFGRPRSAA
jgi:hypothetical protein